MPERWNFKTNFYVDKDVPPQEDKAVRSEMAEDISPYEVRDLKKKSFEKESIRVVEKATNNLLVRYGFDPIVIPNANVHIMDPQDFREQVMAKNTGFLIESSGYALLNHIYIPRIDSHRHFAATLAHETAHIASFTKRDIYVQHDEMGGTVAKLSTRRMGHATGNTRKANELPVGQPLKFSGLNEAVTDYFALQIKKEIVAMGTLINKADRDLFLNDNGYQFHIELILEMLERLAGGDKARQAKLAGEILINHINGDYTVLKKLSQWNKLAPKLLFDMNESTDSVLFVADKLRLDVVANRIRSYFEFVKSTKPS